MLPLLGNNCELALAVNSILAQYDKLRISSSVHCDKNMSALCQLYDAEVTRPLSAKHKHLIPENDCALKPIRSSSRYAGYAGSCAASSTQRPCFLYQAEPGPRHGSRTKPRGSSQLCARTTKFPADFKTNRRYAAAQDCMNHSRIGWF